MTGRDQLLRNLYGDGFNREIGTPQRRACYHLNELLSKLERHESLGNPFYCTVYDYNHKHRIPIMKPAPNYTYNYADNVVLDKIFFDFDKDYKPAAKEEIQNLITISSKKEFILSLLEAGRIKEPINQAKKTARHIINIYGGGPLLVFSGSKGCHLYLFFESLQLDHPGETLKIFTRNLEEAGLFQLNTNNPPGLLDAAPVGDVARISRVPSSRHPETGLYCHPFQLDYSYNEIIEYSQNPEPPFIDVHPEDMRGSLGTVLKEIEDEVKDSLELQKYQRLFKQLEPKPARQGSTSKVAIKTPQDILKLNRWPCFQKTPYTHDLRVIIGTICLHSDLNPEETAEALRIYSQDRGIMEDKHLHHPGHVERNLLRDGKPKYLFTCSSMKTRGLCHECKDWFYLKLNLAQEYYDKIKAYKTIKT